MIFARVWSVNVDFVGESGTHALRCVLVVLINYSDFYFCFCFLIFAVVLLEVFLRR